MPFSGSIGTGQRRVHPLQALVPANRERHRMKAGRRSQDTGLPRSVVIPATGETRDLHGRCLSLANSLLKNLQIAGRD
jgi:hypothetical protein